MMEGGSLGPSVWAVSDGRAGNVAQVRAITDALSEPSRWMRIAHIRGEGAKGEPLILTPQRPWTWLPSALWPAPKFGLPPEQRRKLVEPWPTLWIAAGRRAAPYTAAMRKWSGGATFCVQILDPKMDPLRFDLLVTPAHDDVSGVNVVKTAGSPAYFPPENIEEAGLAFADLADEQGKSCVVVLGGKSKAHDFSEEAVARLLKTLRELAGAGWRLRITTSRRTPDEVVARFRSFAGEVGAKMWTGPNDGANPYLAWLVFSDAAIVTEDSANMLSEAAYHGLPVHIAKLSGGSKKFDRLHQSLIDHGAARWLGEGLENWSYKPLREAERVADIIVDKLLERHAKQVA